MTGLRELGVAEGIWGNGLGWGHEGLPRWFRLLVPFDAPEAHFQ